MLRNLLCGIGAICLAMSLAVHAGDSVVLPDSSAPIHNQPQVLPTAGGLPQVNITTPNGNGLSYNRYQQFDVGRSGVILNNATADANTQLGGWIERNPNLANGSASLIVNEVNSSRQSQMRGFVEVAGQRADVVIANPSGISVDGGGFINANHATLTTGRPVIENGNLTGYDVRGGNIDIYGKGLNNTQSHFTDIIANAVNINAKVHAGQQLNVIAGENFVSRDINEITRLNPDAETGVSLDVSAVGGMYAGQIRLVGTGRGVGVNSVHNAGEIYASVGEVIINADGTLTNVGVISGKGGADIAAGDAFVNTGELRSGGDMRISVQNGSIDNSSSLVSDGGIAINVGGSIQNTDEILGGGDVSLNARDGGIDNQSRIVGGEVLEMHAGTNVVNTGTAEGGTGLVVGADTGMVDNTGHFASGGSGKITAFGDVVNVGGVEAAGGLEVTSATGTVDSRDRLIGGGDVTILAKQDILHSGELRSGGSMSLTAEEGTVVNTAGFQAGGGFSLSAYGDYISNYDITSGGAVEVSSKTGGFENHATILADGNVYLSSQTDLLNTGTIKGTGSLLAASHAGAFANTGEILSNRHIEITSRDHFTNDAAIQGLGDVRITSSNGQLTNAGTIKSGGEGSFIAGLGIENTGSIFTRSGIVLKAKGGDLSTSVITAGGDADVDVAGKLTNLDTLSIGGAINASIGSSVTNSGEFLGDNIFLTSQGGLLNTGTIDGGEVRISASTIENYFAGTLLGDHLALQAENIVNGMPADQTGTGNAGLIGARDRLDIGATSLTNRENGLIYSGGDMYLGGTLDANGFATGTASTILNSSAVIDAGGSLSINAEDFTNYNAHYTTELREVSRKSYNLYTPDGWGILGMVALGPDMWLSGDRYIYCGTMAGSTNRKITHAIILPK